MLSKFAIFVENNLNEITNIFVNVFPEPIFALHNEYKVTNVRNVLMGLNSKGTS